MRCTVDLLAICTGFAIWFGAAGCAPLPQPVPLLGAPGNNFAGAMSFGLPYIPSRAQVSSPGRPPATLKGTFNGDDDIITVPFNPRLGAAAAVSDRVRLSGNSDFLMTGGEVDFLPLGSAARTPVVLSLGGQFNALPLASGASLVWDARTQLSIHPRTERLQGVFGVGVSAGRQRHDFVLPNGPFAEYAEFQFVPIVLRGLRHEGRLEGIIGVSTRVSPFLRVQLAIQPFYVFARGDVTTDPCPHCSVPLHIDSLDASWGAAFTLTWIYSNRD